VMIDWNALMTEERRQFEGMNAASRYRYMLTLLAGVPYGWGKENPEEADCSGSVQFALMASYGFQLRVTADGLYKRVFTVRTPPKECARAIFFVTSETTSHGGRIVPAGTAVHVAGFVEERVVLNASPPGARLEPVEDVVRRYRKRSLIADIRGLNRDRARRISDRGRDCSGLDKELAPYLVMAGDE
jgi:murein DD-endopeptidase